MTLRSLSHPAPKENKNKEQEWNLYLCYLTGPSSEGYVSCKLQRCCIEQFIVTGKIHFIVVILQWLNIWGLEPFAFWHVWSSQQGAMVQTVLTQNNYLVLNLFFRMLDTCILIFGGNQIHAGILYMPCFVGWWVGGVTLVNEVKCACRCWPTVYDTTSAGLKQTRKAIDGPIPKHCRAKNWCRILFHCCVKLIFCSYSPTRLCCHILSKLVYMNYYNVWYVCPLPKFCKGGSL